MQQVATLPPPIRGRLQTAIYAYLRDNSPASSLDIWRALGRPSRDSMHNALSRMSERSYIEHPSKDVYQMPPERALATTIIVGATLDMLVQTFPVELAAELRRRGWER